MDGQKPLEFKAGALDYFILTILSIVLIYIPFLGWAILLNYTGSWFANRSHITGKPVKFTGKFGESFKFVFVNFFLLLITLGIYSFWFYPKLYSYMAERTVFADAELAAAEPVAPVAAPEAPQATPETVIASTAPTVNEVAADASVNAPESSETVASSEQVASTDQEESSQNPKI